MNRFCSYLLIGTLICAAAWHPGAAETARNQALPQEPPMLSNLDNHNAGLRELRRQIAENLKSTARTGRLDIPLQLVRYRVQPEDSFYRIMAKVSQNEDTLVSLNELTNPNEIYPGQVLLIPNARGVFIESDDRAELARKFETEPQNIESHGDILFVPGRKLLPEQIQYFRGDGFGPPLRTGRISSGYGLRIDPFTNRRTFHGGLDIAAPTGTPVYASRSGRVVRAETAAGYGQLIVLEHGYGYQTYYGHLSQIGVRVGQQVAAGSLIGRVGSTGRATGPHLHFEVRKNGRRQQPRLVHGISQ
ncbi:MAG: M23 family metallopeptidase [Leptospiraceae bacterium]|nr:M23 family metallopeptidase [Leptospiraceae bacterium]